MRWIAALLQRWFGGPKPAPPTPPVPPPPPPTPPSSVPTILLAIINRERQAAGVGRLDLDARLLDAAQRHTDAMAARGELSHRLPGEPPLGGRVATAGYAFSSLGENVAGGQETALEVVRDWMSSAGHRANILGRAYLHVGFGLAISRKGTHYWTAVFAAPLAADGGPEVVTLGAPLLVHREGG